MIEWVSVDSSLPPARETVLVYWDGDDWPGVGVAHMDRQGDWFHGHDDEVPGYVTYWAKINLP